METSLWAEEVVVDRYSIEDFEKVEKIDVHAHIHTDKLDFVSLAKRDRVRFLNMAVQSGTREANEERHRTIFLQYAAEPERVVPVSSFPLEGWDEADWVEKTIAYLDRTFDSGAVGVKVWKNIGMELKDRNGRLVMIDDSQFDRIFEHLQKRGVVLIGHLGEPKNCWLPLEEMTTNNDRRYFGRNPNYHMYLHPEMPSYQDQIDARDRMLEKNPNLTFVACHLASLEWSVDELSKFLDRFPNAVTELAARISHLQVQSNLDRQKVIDFFTKYADRIMYGTDIGVRSDADILQAYQQARDTWVNDWRYFNTEDWIEVPNLDYPVQGLGLPKSVTDQIYHKNALRIFTSSWNELRE